MWQTRMACWVAWAVGIGSGVNCFAAVAGPATQQVAPATTRAVQLSNPTSRGSASMLDLDTGQTFGLDQYKDAEFIREAGVDLLCETRAPSEGVVMYDLAMVEVSGTFEEVRSYASVREQLAKVQVQRFEMVALKRQRGALPALYLFRTREGAMGVMEFTAVREAEADANAQASAGGVDLRYRLIVKPGPEPIRETDARIAQAEMEVQVLQGTVGKNNPRYLLALEKLNILREAPRAHAKDGVADMEVKLKTARLSLGANHPVIRRMERELSELKGARERQTPATSPATSQEGRMGKTPMPRS